MKYNFRYDTDDYEDDNYQNKVKTHKHLNKKMDEDETNLKHLNKEKTKKMKKFIKDKYKKYEIEDE